MSVTDVAIEPCNGSIFTANNNYTGIYEKKTEKKILIIPKCRFFGIVVAVVCILRPS